mgnify:FL=1
MEQEILTLQELDSEEWKVRARESVEHAYDEAGNSTVESDAQETLLNFILNIGGIRRDVYEYLLTPRFRDPSAVASVGILLCYGAPCEWIELVVEALDQNSVTGNFYVNEITEAFKAEIPVAALQQLLRESTTVFDFCQKKIALMKATQMHTRKGQEKTDILEKADPQEEAMPGKVSKQESGEEPSAASDGIEAGMAKAVTDAVLAAMKGFLGQKKSTLIVTESKGELDSEPSSWERNDEHKDTITRRQVKVGILRKQREEPINIPDPAQEQEGAEAPEFPDGQEILDAKMLVTELQKEEKAHSDRVSFFQLLLSRHMRKEFEKLDEDAQVGKIFEIMVEKKYRKDKILSIRKLMNGGMTNEFIFSLLEKDLPEEELTELCETLVADMPQLEQYSEELVAEDNTEETE